MTDDKFCLNYLTMEHSISNNAQYCQGPNMNTEFVSVYILLHLFIFEFLDTMNVPSSYLDFTFFLGAIQNFKGGLILLTSFIKFELLVSK